MTYGLLTERNEMRGGLHLPVFDVSSEELTEQSRDNVIITLAVARQAAHSCPVLQTARVLHCWA